MSFNHLRRYRMRSAFTQPEMAFLVGLKCGTNISRFERLHHAPGLKTALAYQILHAVSVNELFPVLCKDVAHGVAERAKVLMEKLASQDQHPKATLKMEILNRVSAQLHALSSPHNEKTKIE